MRPPLRFQVTVLIDEFQIGLALDELPHFEANYNIPPTVAIPVIRQIDKEN